MVKKRGKKAKPSSKKQHKHVPVKHESAQKHHEPAHHHEMERSTKLDETLRELESLTEDKAVTAKLDKVEEKEEEIEVEEQRIEHDTEKVEKLERQIKREVTEKPLTSLKAKDVSKGIIGAFIGVVAYFAFIYGKQIAPGISILKATAIFVFAYILLIILMHETHYRGTKGERLLLFFPKTATVIFVTSLWVIVVIFILFNQVDIFALGMAELSEFYKQVSVTSILAALGAGTADFIEKD